MIPNVVANMEDSTLLATQLIGGLARAAATENSNIVPVDLSKDESGYLQQVMNKLIGTMTNPQTAWSEGAVYYPLEECVIIMKQAFFDRLFSVKNGAILSAGDLPPLYHSATLFPQRRTRLSATVFLHGCRFLYP